MKLKILIVLSFFMVSFAQAETRAKYTPKLPNFFEGSKPRGELISVGQIVATKVKKEEQTSDSFAVNNNSNVDKPLMNNPLGILPKKMPIIQQSKTENKQIRDASTEELESAVSEARRVSEEIRHAMGSNPDYTNPKDINKFLNASDKAQERGQLKSSNNKTEQEIEDFKF